MKKSFILYLDQQELINKLPDETAGKLFKHIFAYVNLEKPATDDPIVDIAFTSIKAALKRDLEKWDNQLEQRSNAGKASAEARKKKAATKSNERSTKSNERSTKSNERSTVVNGDQRNPTDSVNVNVSVNDSDKEEIKKSARFEKPTEKELKEFGIEKTLNLDGMFDYYESNGWRVGRNPMKDWRATARNWSKRQGEFGGNNEQPARKVRAFGQ